jgi:mRNA interferase RelE/StbE
MNRIWAVELSPQAIVDLKGLDGPERTQTKKGIDKLKTDPQLRGHALGGNLSGYRTLVVGKRKIRIVFRVIDDCVLVLVIAIWHRRNNEVYLKAATRNDDGPEG